MLLGALHKVRGNSRNAGHVRSRRKAQPSGHQTNQGGRVSIRTNSTETLEILAGPLLLTRGYGECKTVLEPPVRNFFLFPVYILSILFGKEC